MYLPDEGIVFAGDLTFNDRQPYLEDGYPQEWKRALTEFGSMKISVAVSRELLVDQAHERQLKFVLARGAVIE